MYRYDAWNYSSVIYFPMFFQFRFYEMVNMFKLVLSLISITLHIFHTESRIIAKRDVESKVVICLYHPHEAPYTLEDGRFSPEDIDTELCTHLDYAFGKPDLSAGILPFDKYQDIDLAGYKRFNDLKTKNAKLKTMISVGGTDEGSQLMSRIAMKPETRIQFAKNLVDFLKLHNFDGIVIRWQWPQEGDRQNHVALLKDIREIFDKSSPPFLIGSGLPDGVDDIDKGYDLPEMNKYVDFIIVMSFDYIFFRQRNLAHVAPLYSSTDPDNDRYTVDYTIRHVLKKGTDPQKVIVGVSTFGSRYTLDNTRDTIIGSPAREHTYEKGRLAYSEICERLKNANQWQIVRSKNHYSGPYAFRGKDWMSYDDPEMIEEKARYVKAKGLKGISFCHLSLDDFRGACHGIKYPIIRAGSTLLLDGSMRGSAITPVNQPGIKEKENDFVLPACLYYETSAIPELTSGQSLKTAGFGIDETGSLSPTLKVVSLPYVTTTECLKRAAAGITDFLSRDKFCAGNKTGEAVDQGDSGGGLMYQNPDTSLYYLWGIVSFKATQISPVAVFTNVQNHINWILSIRNSVQKA